MGSLESLEYDAVCQRILAIPKFTKEKHGFSVIRRYLERMGNPHRGMRVIHVAGTNGKGSVSRMISDLLREAGRRTGSFFSPHLVRMNERMQVDGKEIRDGQLAEAYRVAEGWRKKENLPQLTFFELLFVMALWYFRQEGAEDIVLETGLGGRLDATTGIPADLYVITRLGLDHREQLGSTLEEIAGEKAGIITGTSPLILHSFGEDGSMEEKRAEALILEKAREMGVKKIVNCNGIRPEIHEIRRDGIDFSFTNGYDRVDHLWVPSEALYQTENAITAVSAAPFLLPDMKKEERMALVKRALSGFRMEGRLEQVQENVYLDGAHNPSAAGVLRKSLENVLRTPRGWKKGRLIFAASGDKDYLQVLAILGDIPWDEVILTRYGSSRAADPAGILAEAGDCFLPETNIRMEKDPKHIMNEIFSQKYEGVTLVTGSLYLVGEAKAVFQKQESEHDRF